MTPDEIVHQLKYQAALFAFNKLAQDEVARLFDELTVHGIYHDEFLPVIDGDDYWPAYRAALVAALDCLAISVPPSRDEAAWQITRHHLQAAVSGPADPLQSLKWLMDDLYRDYDFDGDIYVGDRIGLSKLVGAYWKLDEWDAYPPDPRELENLRGEVRQEAAIWLKDWSDRVPASK